MLQIKLYGKNPPERKATKPLAGIVKLTRTNRETDF